MSAQGQSMDLMAELRDLYQDLLDEGVLEDMELYHIDPIRMVSQDMASFIRKMTGEEAPSRSEDDGAEETAVFSSSILAAAESLPQPSLPSQVRMESITAPLRRSVALLRRIIDDESAVQVSKEVLRQNLEILEQCLTKLER